MDDTDRRILAFEKQWWRYEGARVEAIREEFDLSPTQYAQRLWRLLGDPAAELTEPVLVARLRRRVAAKSRRVA